MTEALDFKAMALVWEQGKEACKQYTTEQWRAYWEHAIVEASFEATLAGSANTVASASFWEHDYYYIQNVEIARDKDTDIWSVSVVLEEPCYLTVSDEDPEEAPADWKPATLTLRTGEPLTKAQAVVVDGTLGYARLHGLEITPDCEGDKVFITDTYVA
jgi:hypothetical protein